jgi:uncharacterized protein with GYD domain
MARYVTLLRFTDQGARAIGKSADRAAAFKKAADKAGVTVETQLWTAGACDGVLVLSGEEKKILGLLTRLAGAGNVRTETLQAFDAAEFKALAR